MDKDRVLGGIVGMCTGDAVGLPVEYRSRGYLREDPVTDMIGFGTHNQPPGTWSSDASLSLCTLECLAEGFSLAEIAARYVVHVEQGSWTPRGSTIDLLPEMREKISRLARRNAETMVNTNDDMRAFSVLSRTLSLGLASPGLSHEERFKRVAQVASLTNGHMRTILGCYLLSEVALELAAGRAPGESYLKARKRVSQELASEPELASYERVLKTDLSDLREEQIFTEGSVIHTVEAALWCLLTEGDFRSTVLKAVNLGGDTETTGSVTGGLAGYAYGLSSIPEEWIAGIARRKDIVDLAERAFSRMSRR